VTLLQKASPATFTQAMRFGCKNRSGFFGMEAINLHREDVMDIVHGAGEFNDLFGCYGKFVKDVEGCGTIGLNAKERLFLLTLPTILDDYGCVPCDFKMLRNRLFPEMGISLHCISQLIRKLCNMSLVVIHTTNCNNKILYARYCRKHLPKSTIARPDLPLPPQVDWFPKDDGSIEIRHSE
jgi:hypothetical protein